MTLAPGTRLGPYEIVETRISSWERAGAQYAVTADGQRFLVNTSSDTILPVTLVLNWTAVLGTPGQ